MTVSLLDPTLVIAAVSLAVGWLLAMADAVTAGAWEWLKSPGFAGTAAVVAAVVAYGTARKDRRQKDRAERKAQWWRRAEWALNRVTDRDDFTARIGLSVLDALGNSEWAEEHEADVIAAATAPFLSESSADTADTSLEFRNNGSDREGGAP